MPEYLHPGVYTERKPAESSPAQGVGTSTGAFVGSAQRGKVGVATLLTSWDQYKKNFAFGLASPFVANSYLAYAVYGFFQNGGSRCYVSRVAGSGAAKASYTIQDASSASVMKVEAIDEGTWAGGAVAQAGVGLEVILGEGTDAGLKLTLKLNGNIVETFDGFVINDAADENFAETMINTSSNFVSITVIDGSKTPVTGTTAHGLTGGNDGAVPTATEFQAALKSFDPYPVNLVALPGGDDTVATGAALAKDYAASRKDCIAIVELAKSNDDPTSALAAKNSFGGSDFAAMYWPWIKVVDPLSKAADPTKLVPPCGHVMGVIARTDGERGVWKAPAGTGAAVVGAVALAYNTSDSEQDTLNPKGVNVIRAFPNAGIIIWGARTCSADPSLRFLPIQRSLIYIEQSLKDGTQYAVFEPNNEALWARMRITANTFLMGMMRGGAFASNDMNSAFRVKCDAGLNDSSAQDEGKVYMEIGVALVKPAEFIILKIGQQRLSA